MNDNKTDEKLEEIYRALKDDDACKIYRTMVKTEVVDPIELFFHDRKDLPDLPAKEWEFFKSYYIDFYKTGSLPTNYPEDLDEEIRASKALYLAQLYLGPKYKSIKDNRASIEIFQSLAEDYPENGFHNLALHYLMRAQKYSKAKIKEQFERLLNARSFRVPGFKIHRQLYRSMVTTTSRYLTVGSPVVPHTIHLILDLAKVPDTEKTKRAKELNKLAVKLQSYIETSTGIETQEAKQYYKDGHYLKVKIKQLRGIKEDIFSRQFDPLLGGVVPIPSRFKSEDDELNERYLRLNKSDKSEVERYNSDRKEFWKKVNEYMKDFERQNSYIDPFDELKRADCNRDPIDDKFQFDRDHMDLIIDRKNKGDKGRQLMKEASEY